MFFFRSYGAGTAVKVVPTGAAPEPVLVVARDRDHCWIWLFFPRLGVTGEVTCQFGFVFPTRQALGSAERTLFVATELLIRAVGTPRRVVFSRHIAYHRVELMLARTTPEPELFVARDRNS